MIRLRKLAQASSRDVMVLGVVVAILAIVPFGVSRFTLSVAISALIFALAGIGWNVLSGFAGQFSFGHAAYFGLGAYTVAVTLTKYSISPWLGLILGGLCHVRVGRDAQAHFQQLRLRRSGNRHHDSAGRGR
jgi:branched-chain amino acid transport system permease protein